MCSRCVTCVSVGGLLYGRRTIQTRCPYLQAVAIFSATFGELEGALAQRVHILLECLELRCRRFRRRGGESTGVAVKKWMRERERESDTRGEVGAGEYFFCFFVRQGQGGRRHMLPAKEGENPRK